MRKFYAKNRKIFINTALLIIVYGFFFYLNYRNLKIMNNDLAHDFTFLLTTAFTSFSSIYEMAIARLLELVMLMLLPLYVFAGDFREDIIITYTYVFTRYGSKNKWLLKRFAYLAEKLLVFEIFRLGLTLLFTFIFCRDLNFTTTFVQAFGLSLLLDYLHLLFWLSFENILAVSIGDTISVIISLIFYVANLVILNLSQGRYPAYVYYLFVPANSMYFWHTDAISVSGFNPLKLPGNSFYLGISALVLLLATTIIYLLFAFRLNRQDSYKLLGGQ